MRVILYQPDIAQNLGATLRLCACFNTGLDIIEPCGFPLNAKALKRTAMDYADKLTWQRHTSWKNYTQTTHGGRLILLTTRASACINEFHFKADDRLVFGRESAGAPALLHESAHTRLRIPIHPDARSFNLATSVAIALYEALRQTRQLP